MENNLIFETAKERALAYRAKGAKIIGYLCSYCPEEILHAAGVLPFRILGGGAPTADVDSYLPTYVCSFMRSALDRAVKGDYDFLDGLLGVHTCDTVCGTFFVWRKNVSMDFFHFIRIPHVIGEEGEKFLYNELLKLKKSLEEFLGKKISEGELVNSIRVYNKNRQLLKEVARLRGRGALEGSLAFKVMLEGFALPKEEHNKILEQLLADVGISKVNVQRKRVHVSGSVISDFAMFKLIEECGAIIVSDDLCTGSRYYFNEVPEDSEPLRALARRYVGRVPCCCMHPAEPRFEYTIQAIKENEAEAVIVLVEKFCDPYLFDYPYLKQMLEKMGIPHVFIEVQQGLPGKAQIQTRLQAFLESLS